MAIPTAADWKKDFVYLEDRLMGFLCWITTTAQVCKPPDLTTTDEFVEREQAGQSCWALGLVLAAHLLLQGQTAEERV